MLKPRNKSRLAWVTGAGQMHRSRVEGRAEVGFRRREPVKEQHQLTSRPLGSKERAMGNSWKEEGNRFEGCGLVQMEKNGRVERR